MSLDSNRKILIGSVMQSLDKRLIIGDTDNQAVVLVSMIINYIEYCMNQYNAGNEEYFNKIKTLNKLVHKLKYQCPDVCIYRDRLIITKLNTPPNIDSNTINLLISNNQQPLMYNDVVHNYSDAENDLISQIVFLDKEDEADLLIDNNPVVINNIYQPNINFSIKYQDEPNSHYLILNSETKPCESSIISLDATEYNNALQTHNVVNIHDGSNTVLQAINNNVEKLPNDTIIYVHIDTSSLTVPDQETIRDVTLEWWEGFKMDNPNFQGSLIINTVPNDQIDTDFAPGRGDDGRCTIAGSTILNGTVEAWLENPAEGLLRQAYKEGLPTTFADEVAFQAYIQDKSLVVLTYVDETYDEYHAADNVSFISTVQGIFQPTVIYITDYNNYIFKVRPFLKFFKGVMYPITRTTSIQRNNFLLHAMAAIEATTLTPAEIDAYFEPDKVAAYGPTNMQNFFYDNLATNNPYSNLPGLKDTGWEGKYYVTSPASDVLTSDDFAEELDDILTNTSNVQVSIVEVIEIPSENLGNSVSATFDLKVRDNNPQQPLFSEEEIITVNFGSECEDTPDCDGNTNTANTGHKDNYTFILSDFTDDTNVENIKLTGINIPNGQLKYYNLTIVPSTLPLIIPVQDIINGELVYTPDSTIQEDYTISLNYSLSFAGSINYCNTDNILELTKDENPNKPPTIVTEDKNIELALPTDTGTTTIKSTVNYNGTGGYIQFWQRTSGASDVQLLNPTDEDLQLANLKPGVYTFQITVITNEDTFIVTETSTVTVTVANQAPIVDAGADNNITLPTNTSGATATASDSDGTIDIIAWQQMSGPNTATINNGNTLNPTFNNLIQGVYVFQVVVTDNDNITGSDTMQVTVNGAVNSPPTVTSITFPNGNCCNGLLTLTANFDYNGHSSEEGALAPSGHIYPLTTSFLTSVYTGSNPIQSIKSLISPSIGDIGVYLKGEDASKIISPNESIPIDKIGGMNESYFDFWARGVHATENNGDFTTTWYYSIIDNTNTAVNNVELTLHAADIPPVLRTGVLEVDDCNDNNGQNTLVERFTQSGAKPLGFSNIDIGNTFVLRGTLTPFNGGNNWFRLTFGGENQFYDHTLLSVSTSRSRVSKLGLSHYMVQIDKTGKIIKVEQCSS